MLCDDGILLELGDEDGVVDVVRVGLELILGVE
jgi:hypothetical protein